MKNADCTVGDGRRIFIRIYAMSGRFTANELNTLVRNKFIKCSHSIAAAADAGNDCIRQFAFLCLKLFLNFLTDNLLEIPDDHRKWMRSHDRTQNIMGIIYPAGPFFHCFIDCIL